MVGGRQINTRACGISSQVSTAGRLASLVPGSSSEVSVAQLKMSKKLKSKKCIKSNRVEVEYVSSNHHVKVQGSRDGMVSQELLEIKDTSTVSAAEVGSMG